MLKAKFVYLVCNPPPNHIVWSMYRMRTTVQVGLKQVHCTAEVVLCRDIAVV